MQHHDGSSRRLFLKTSAAAAMTTWIPAASYARIMGSNDRLNMAVVGTGGIS